MKAACKQESSWMINVEGRKCLVYLYNNMICQVEVLRYSLKEGIYYALKKSL